MCVTILGPIVKAIFSLKDYFYFSRVIFKSARRIPFKTCHWKQFYVSWFLGFLGIRQFQALSAILREQNQAFSGTFRQSQALPGKIRGMILHDLPMIAHDSAWSVWGSSITAVKVSALSTGVWSYQPWLKSMKTTQGRLKLIEIANPKTPLPGLHRVLHQDRIYPHPLGDHGLRLWFEPLWKGFSS